MVLIKSFSSYFAKFFWLILFSILFFPPLINSFDSHHDGLVLTTLNMTKRAIENGGPLPFNQYGPFWALTYSYLLLPFNDSLTLILSRVITMLIYIMVAWYLKRFSRLIDVEFLGTISVVLFVVTQPWSSGSIVTFLAWPSALAMLLLIILTHATVQIDKGLNVFTNAYVAGCASTALIFTRFQIGVMALMTAGIVLLVVIRKGNVLFRFLAAFLFSQFAVVSYLIRNQWLEDFYHDDVLYGFTYIQDKYSLNPFPKYTIILTVISFLCLLIFGRFIGRIDLGQFDKIKFLNVLPLISGTLIVSVAFLNFPTMLRNFLLVSRKMWVAVFLSYTIFIALSLMISIFKGLHLTKLQKQEFILLVFGLVGLVQIYPQFDPVHFWWGSVPLVIALSIRLSILLSKYGLPVRSAAIAIIGVFGFLALLIPTIKVYESLSSSIASNEVSVIRISQDTSIKEEELQEFFKENMVINSPVLNLCHNSNVFFSENFAISASRYFLYWPPFISNSLINSEILRARPRYIVTCPQDQIPAAQRDTLASQRQIIKKLKFKSVPSASLVIDGATWAIFEPHYSQ